MKQSNKYSDFTQALKAGKVCVFETDTVVGIACVLFVDGNINLNSINKIYRIKQRDTSKSLPWLISSKEMLCNYAINIRTYARDLIDKKWPGATTFIFEIKNDKLKNTNIVSMQKEVMTAAFRIPDVADIIKGINEASSPLLCTSANLSGQDAVSNIDEVNDEILNNVDFVYTKKLCKNSDCKASEIISCLNKEPKIIRQ